MNYLKKKPGTAWRIIAGCALSATIVQADVAVQFAPLSTSTQPALRAATTTTGTSKVWNFSDSTELFAGTAASGTKIYGGMSAAVTVGTIVSDPSISLVNGRLVVQATGGSGYVGTLKGALVWDKGDFLAASTVPFAFDDASSLSVTLFRNDGLVRWVLRDGGTYYISDTTVVGQVSATLSGTDSVQWAAWDPTANGGADFAHIPTNGFAAHSFADVTAVGLYFEAQRGADLVPRFTLSDGAGGGFTANLTVEYDHVTSLASGAWDDPAIWSGNTVPASGDDVNLFNAAEVTISNSAVCANLSIGDRASASRLLLQSGSLEAEGIHLSENGTVASAELRVAGGTLAVPILRVGDSDTDAATTTRLEFSGGASSVSEVQLSSLDGKVDVVVDGSAATIDIGTLAANAGANQPYQLDFVLDAVGVSPIQVGGTADVGSNLVAVAVDFANYAAGVQSIELVAAGTFSGTFADISVKNLSPYISAHAVVDATGLSIELAQNDTGLAIGEDGQPIDIVMEFVAPHWKLRWPTARGKRYQVQVSRDGLQSWQAHGEPVIGTGWAHYSYVPMDSIGNAGFARVLVSDRAGETQASSPPNILMLVSDDMNDWPGFATGRSSTPNLDALAARGMGFRNAHISTTYCTPSRNALFTGKHPVNTGFYENNVHFFSRPDLESLPAYFKRAGYDTYGAGKVYHHMPGYIDMAAYTEYYHWNPNEKTRGWPYNAWSEDNQARPTDPVLLAREYGAIPNEHEPFMADSMTADFAIAKLQETRDKPFFMTIGTYAPHLSRFAPQKYFDLYPTNSMYQPEIHLDDLDDLDPSIRITLPKTPEGDIDYEALVREIQSYHACVSYADAQHGRILDALAASAYASNTIVVFWSDNGYHLGEKLRDGKHTVWERTSNVPFIWAGPGIPGNRVYDHVVEILDTYPTLVEMAGLPQKEGLDGTSLVPVFQNPSKNYGRVAVQVSAEGTDVAIITDDWRYIHRPGKLNELYDWRADAPGGPDTFELNNLINDPAYASVVAELSAHVPAHPAAPAAVNGKNPGDLRLITAEIDPSLGESYYWELIQ